MRDYEVKKHQRWTEEAVQMLEVLMQRNILLMVKSSGDATGKASQQEVRHTNPKPPDCLMLPQYVTLRFILLPINTLKCEINIIYKSTPIYSLNRNYRRNSLSTQIGQQRKKEICSLTYYLFSFPYIFLVLKVSVCG